MAKLNYMKPLLQFDPITLINNAGGCVAKAESAMYHCRVYDRGWYYFDDSDGTTCDIIGDPDNFCYYTPTADINIYSS